VREKADRKVADSILMNSCRANFFETAEATYNSYFSTGIRDPHALLLP
jgi:hypothetical protein